jgi:diguanylate cyclase (GGDEF)-like protein/PAS domain S-box-containing protein
MSHRSPTPNVTGPQTGLRRILACTAAWIALGVAPSLLAEGAAQQWGPPQATGGGFAWPVLAGGLLAGALLAGLAFALSRARRRVLALTRAHHETQVILVECQRAERTLRESEERLQGIVNMTVEAIIAVDRDFRIVLFNPAAQKMFGYTEKEAIGSSVELLIPGRLHEIHRHHVDHFVDGGRSRRPMGEAMEVLGLRADGVEFPVEATISRIVRAGNPLYSVILSDVSARKSNEEQLKFLANYDPLTSLPNRSLFNPRLERALAHAQRFNKGLAVLFLDLDRFKNINDTLGHAAGDGVLREVAARLMACVREIDTVARLGGDEFVILVEQVTDARQAGSVGQKLIRTLAEPLQLGDHECSVTASVGISTYPADGEDAASLLKNADIAMYRAKEQGKNNVQFYTPNMNIHSVQRLTLESGLRRALQREEFLLHYQPKVDIASGRVTGMEALVRWKRPGSGMVSPAEFIPLAEETGLIVAIGEWVLKAACEYTHLWHRGGAGMPPLRVAVNLSARQFAQPSLVRDVARILDTTGLQPGALDLEITESMVMGNPEQAIQTLRQLKSMGISLSIDDFGTGYSSLGYLKRFPLDHIKIDRSFIKDIPEDNDDATITRTIIAMAHNLRLKVIAEGVETEAQLNFLREHGCDEMQGYYFSRPLPGNEFNELLKAREGKAALAA